MIQEFYKTTIISKYIKYLLSNTPIPLYKVIDDMDTMIAGCVYTHKDKVLRCTKTGTFVASRNSMLRTSNIVVSDRLRVHDSDDLIISNDIITFPLCSYAEYDVIETFIPSTYKPNVSQQFKSTVSYYDDETHKWLGEYLRYLRNLHDIDLMPLYNCYGNTVSHDFHLTATDVSQIVDTSKKVLLVPIKFNKQYTIAIDCALPIRLKSVFYHNRLINAADNKSLLTNRLSDKVVGYNNTDFSKPFLFTINCDEPDLYNYEKYLYLAIEVPSTHTSPLVVLEGDYTNIGVPVEFDVYEMSFEDKYYFKPYLLSDLSLLSINDGKQRPFADKLVQFLLRNTIDTREQIDDNVKNVERNTNCISGYAGQWDIFLRRRLYDKYMSLDKRDDLNFMDITGYVDNDIENAIRKGYMK